MIKVNGESLEHRPGMTVREVLKAKSFVFPLIIVKVDGELVGRDRYEAHVVPDGADVQVIHLMSGG
ncbi:MAG TPA: thiamine biosynthesis protein ThiS [Myxococcales bacterium]|mgnify:FL=1|jgi:sulfur carrier protein|nr:thiamine biosynthesis protein ThiS [Myxococcales bacterium]